MCEDLRHSHWCNCGAVMRSVPGYAQTSEQALNNVRDYIHGRGSGSEAAARDMRTLDYFINQDR